MSEEALDGMKDDSPLPSDGEEPVVDEKAEKVERMDETADTVESERIEETAETDEGIRETDPKRCINSEESPSKQRKIEDSETKGKSASASDDEDAKSNKTKSNKSAASKSSPSQEKRMGFADCNGSSTVHFEFCPDDSTPQCFFGPHKSSLSALCCEGFQYLLSATRSNKGFISGTYCFEIQWVEKARSTGFVSVGLSTRSTGKRRMLPTIEDCILFCSNGNLFRHDAELFPPFDRSHRVSVAFDCTNADKANISLYCDGKRVSPMVDFTDSMKEALRKGEGVFPTLVTRSSSVIANFGPHLIVPLPFQAKMISQASIAHTVPNPRADESPEVLFVIQFAAQTYNVPDGYFEVSDKSLYQWAIESENAYNGSFDVKSLDEREQLFQHYMQLCASLRRKLCILTPDLLRVGKRDEMRRLFSSFKQRAIVRLQPVTESAGKDYGNYTLPHEFNDVVYETPKDEAECILTAYINHHKLNEKLEPSIPSTFQVQLDERNNQVATWKRSLKSVNLPEPDDEERDVMSVKIENGGQDGLPLFAFFSEEDWAIFDLRSNFVSMFSAFKAVTAREGFHVKHLEHYYQHYFKKAWKPSTYGCTTIEDVLEIVPDCTLDKEVLQLQSEDITPSTMLRLTEIERQERQFRLECGDETAKLKFSAKKDRRRSREKERERSRSRSRRNYRRR